MSTVRCNVVRLVVLIDCEETLIKGLFAYRRRGQTKAENVLERLSVARQAEPRDCVGNAVRFGLEEILADCVKRRFEDQVDASWAEGHEAGQQVCRIPRQELAVVNKVFGHPALFSDENATFSFCR